MTTVKFRCLLLMLATLTAANAGAASNSDTWVLRGSRIYTAPDAAPIDHGVLVVRGNSIIAVGRQDAVSIPRGAIESTCNGGIITAGFQNSHVHFTGEQWLNARQQPAEMLSRKFEIMLSKYGFTTVVDIASDRDNTLALRARVTSGEVRAPRILTVGLPLFPPNGLPFYIADFPKAFLDQLPQPATAADAIKAIDQNMQLGSDATKLFVATPQADGSIKRMSPDIARAAADATHRHQKWVFAHPTDAMGVRLAVDSGVDILAHTSGVAEGPWPAALVADLVAHQTALIPTLKLWTFEMQKQHVPAERVQEMMRGSMAQLAAFSAAGGQVLFGTDVGYMTDFDTADEYALMTQAGLTPMQILASLTTSPAARWQRSRTHGQLASGMAADIVVLERDPAVAATNFAAVRCTFRDGNAIFQRIDR